MFFRKSDFNTKCLADIADKSLKALKVGMVVLEI